ncbi:hypothetical protein Dsin_028057 [Dipteronia sinensis]|uniref:Protein kinase domain-containing protein n=1 Tax=Dipteronia sinensis TaxID=43782 RepID=A0AAD9ZRI1_9ROSI|nr:hypothetical protein Dsin_028057 [Dipteronia sinensis]
MIPPLLFQLMILLSWPINALAESPAIAKPNCPTSCGSVSIQFPFGIGAGCYLDDRYEVTCISSTPFLRSINLTVLNISISFEASTILVNHTVFKSCNFESIPGEIVRNETVNLKSSPFFFSVENRFTGVGCNTFAYLSSNRSIISGCISVCEKSNNPAETMPLRNITLRDSGCNGIECCQTRIPSSLNLQQLLVTLSTTNYKEDMMEQSKCKSAFLVDQEWFGKNIYSPDKAQGLKHVPVLLDWGILESSFDQIERNLSKRYDKTSDCNQTFANSTFTDASTNANFTMPVRRCRCSPGYEGNPYLLQGCQDIDECKIIERICHPSNAVNCTETKDYYKYYKYCGTAVSDTVCINTDGGYECYPKKIYRHIKSLIMIGIVIGFGGLFLLIGAWWLYIIVKRRKNIKLKKEYFKRNGGLLLQQQLTSLDGSVDRCKLFNSKELDKATDHFNMDRILGQGGQGTVYKGMLTDGKIVAVKKSKAVDEGKIEEFVNEVAILSQINHRNVVKLLGCCLETEVPLLVYEFIPNGTLLHYLHNQAEEFPLKWDMRLQIAIEVAGALCYLHSSASFPIYHRDIKSANILLDAKYRAKVADFGTSRSIAIDQTHVTTKVQGTFGYLDPEYFQSSQFTDKSDVYSFGVVLVELLTGQKAISSTSSQDNRSLATHFIVSMVENNLFDILDPEVTKVGKKEEIMTVANLAKRCLNLNGKKRPTMKEVATVLEGIQASQKESNVQQNYEEVEYVRTELIEPWDVVSTASGSTFEIVSKSVDVQPLLTM